MGTRTKSAPSLTWAPYGCMCETFEDGADHPSPPGAWKGPPFKDWVDGIADQISEFAWPRWRNDEWQGSAAATAVALTSADLAIMSRLWPQFCQQARQTGDKKNSWWFNWEDDLGIAPWDIRLGVCFPGCGIAPQLFQTTFADGAANEYYGSIPFMLKRMLQRPRAYQTSWILGMRCVVLQPSVSAWSPSAISGHAFQGLMGCLALHQEFAALGPYRKELLKLAVDIGDRRVLAGIHYPSDNAMSWWVAFQCVEHIAANDNEKGEMLQFIRDAVSGSLVWAEMQASPAHGTLVKVLTPLVTGTSGHASKQRGPPAGPA
jgi:hypothetical protein